MARKNRRRRVYFNMNKNYDEKFDNFLKCVSDSIFVAKSRILAILKMMYVLGLCKGKKSVSLDLKGLGIVKFKLVRRKNLLVTVKLDEEFSEFILDEGELDEEKIKRLFT